MTLTDYMCQEKKEEENCQHWRQRWHIDTTTRRLHKKRGGRLIKDTRNNTDNTRINRTEINIKQNGKKNNSLDVLNDLQSTSQMWLRKGNLKRETESLLMVAQNNAVRTNHIKARIDKMQQNSRCRLFGDRDKTINHIISECSQLTQKEYKNRHD